MFRLRLHHGLCIQHFKGKGYSDKFVSNMAEKISFLNGENPVITLICGTDEICFSCPNNQLGICKNNLKVSYMDKKCLQLLGLKENCKMNYKQYKFLIHNKILNHSNSPEVCDNCQWHSICYP